ncbi:fungal hydrophobin-domain-containing protein [Crassisporium funariophilum]|nr:fungal hydrophobin-domain-containing protein [Crassisporium funariophilum]KAF8163775.1 fungal hydrophobin-domain-containing protein [Crassisporium funariophilum]
MFSRISPAIVFFFFFITLAAATHTVTVTTYAPTPTPPPASQCNTGGLQCCNSVQQSGGSVVSALLGLLGLAVAPITALVGATCSPIDILGIGAGGQCTAQPVCCQNNSFNGVVAIGCTPITLGL